MYSLEQGGRGKWDGILACIFRRSEGFHERGFTYDGIGANSGGSLRAKNIPLSSK